MKSTNIAILGFLLKEAAEEIKYNLDQTEIDLVIYDLEEQGIDLHEGIDTKLLADLVWEWQKNTKANFM